MLIINVYCMNCNLHLAIISLKSVILESFHFSLFTFHFFLD